MSLPTLDQAIDREYTIAEDSSGTEDYTYHMQLSYWLSQLLKLRNPDEEWD